MTGQQSRFAVRTPIVPIALCTVVLLCASPLMAGPMEDFAALEIQMEIATEEFYEATEAPGTTEPKDMRRDVLARMDKLVESSKGDPDGGSIAAGTFSWAMEIDVESAFKRFQLLTRDFKDSPNLVDTFEIVPYVYEESATPKEWIKELEKLSASTRETDVKAGAHFVAGQIQLSEKHLEKAKTAFETARKLSPDSLFATNAKGYIFEIEHLQVGMVAPDFTIKTLEGKETSLKSFRGKAVLLNFWASW